MEIIFFAVVAALVLGRLYQVLGQNRGAEPPPSHRSFGAPSSRAEAVESADPQTETSDNANNVVQLRERVYEGPGAEGMKAISQAQRGFDPIAFVDGARQAYALIVTAYGSGDEAALKPLVDQDVFEAYQSVMSQRRTDNAPKIEVVRISQATIVDAQLVGKLARIDVAFATDLADGGDGLRATDEIWSFERDIDSRNPNWLLSAVQTK
jgi:predicted lipid-binding transport protein (Tim44 family)